MKDKVEGIMGIPIMGFIAPSGTGKTTLMEQVIAKIAALGYRVAAIKHGHHSAEPDTPGKDSYRFRQAGAETVLFVGPERWFMIQERDRRVLKEHLHRLQDHDMILIEGDWSGTHPKIAVHRKATPIDWIDKTSNVVAIASDAALEEETLCHLDLPRLPLQEIDTIVQFILRYSLIATAPHA